MSLDDSLFSNTNLENLHAIMYFKDVCFVCFIYSTLDIETKNHILPTFFLKKYPTNTTLFYLRKIFLWKTKNLYKLPERLLVWVCSKGNSFPYVSDAVLLFDWLTNDTMDHLIGQYIWSIFWP